MKKLLFILSMIVCVNMMFAQGTATVTIGTVNNPVAGPVVVPVTLDTISNPNPFGDDLISGFALYFYYDASVLVGAPSITMNSYWTTQGSAVTNTIVDSPEPGMNTIALIWATGGQITGSAGQNIANITFNYTAGSIDLLWTTAKSTGGVDDVKKISYITDYDGVNYLLNTNPGCD